ncbi:MAG: response regulator [Lachnospiraceae bacterium]|nr:response regulator [Lachnospiraceae bacterium]
MTELSEERQKEEFRTAAHLIMLITMGILGLVLIILNRVLRWEIWMIPVIVAGIVVCFSMYISHRVREQIQIYICGVFLLFLTFYYVSNIDTVYDSSALVIIMIMIFAFAGERVLTIASLLIGLGGMGLHLVLRQTSGKGLILETSSIIRTCWAFVIVGLAYMLIVRIMHVWERTQKEFTEQVERITEENARANNFLANVSHEIRTPINAVIGLSAVMEKDELPERVRDSMEAISEAGHRVAEQIGDILDFTEIDMKRLAVTKESYIIDSLINDLLVQLSFTENYGLDLVIDMEPDIPLELVGDGTKIKKILWHLISNGYKFTREGGVYVHLHAVPREYGINLVIEVTDTGIGMSADDIEHIYDRFFQLDSGRSRTTGGLGLGIPIANGFTKAMGGVLAIDSVPGEGTTARVSLPQGVINAAPCLSVRNKENCVVAGFLGFMTTGHPKIREFYMEFISHLVIGLGVSFYRIQSREELERFVKVNRITHFFVGTGEYLENREYIEELSHQMNVALVADIGFKGEVPRNITMLPKPFHGAQVANFLNQGFSTGDTVSDEVMTCPGLPCLVVDDEPMNLLVARGIFETYGMVVTTVSGGQEAIDICGRQDFGIIFMDHMMPGMDGVEAMKLLRKNAAREKKELCIVALTANAISSAKEMFLSEGFDGFVPKPIEIPELERVLKRVLPKSVIVYEQAPKKKKTASASKKKADIRKKAPETETKKDDEYSGIRACGVDPEQGIQYCMGDRNFYKELLSEYIKDRQFKLSELAAYVKEEDLKDYAIRIHALKSTSKMIGALSLSEQARVLEEAAKEGDGETVRKKHPALLTAYEELLNAIEALSGEKEPEKKSASDDEILEFDPEGSDL